ncbi:LysR family transcriptional regulator [Gordonia sp. CPCC 205515]|uniref:LysR family transcriptional regulator n=1 Tax=Gordonia sp. CPCC 205515 TaxID=3140791 RepID=UPI003AF3BE4E
MDLIRHLRFFVAVAEEGHFGDAAARLEMTQPPVSQGLRRLEKAYGVTLIRRTSRGAELTDAGRELLPRARLLVDDAARIGDEARRLATLSEVLRWGAVPHLGSAALARCARVVGAASPAQEMLTAPATSLVEQVLAGSLDVAVVDHPCVTGTLHIGPVIRVPRHIVVPAGHEVVTATRPRLRQLGDLIFCHPPRSWNPPAYDQLLDGIRESGLNPPVRSATSEAEMIAAVAGGAAFGLTAHPNSLRDIAEIECTTAAAEATRLRLRVIHRSPDHADIAAALTDSIAALGGAV